MTTNIINPAQRQRWLEERRRGIGASDIPKVCGLSGFQGGTPFHVYLDKLGLLPPQPESAQMRWGHRLEEVIACAYAEATARTVACSAEAIVRHPEHPWLFASPDRVVVGGAALLECKTARTAEGWGRPSLSASTQTPEAEGEGNDDDDEDASAAAAAGADDRVPRDYLLQCQWQLMAAEHLGVRAVDLAVLIAGSDLRIYRQVPNRAVQAELLCIGQDFWRLVEARTPPDVPWSHPGVVRLLDLLHPPDPDDVVVLGGDEAVRLATEYEELGAALAVARRAREEVRARLTALMGAASVAVLPDGREVTRRLVVTPEKEIPAHVRPRRESVRLTVRRPKTEEGAV